MALIGDEIRLTRDSIRYGFAVGKIRVLETRVIDRGALERLLDANTFAEQKRLLSETPYGRFLEGAETPEAVERSLDEALESWFRFLDEAELPAEVSNFFLVQYDYNNLRAAAKARVLGAPLTGLLTGHGAVPIEAFSADLGALPEALGEVARSLPDMESEDAPALAEALLAVDDAVDRGMFAEMLRLAKASRSRFLMQYTQLRIDLANVRTLVRGSIAGLSAARVTGSLIDGGTIDLKTMKLLAGSSSSDIVAALRARPELRSLPDVDLADPDVLDVAVESLALAAIERGRRGPIGPEPVIAYVLARQVEVSLLRVLLLGQLAGTDPETLRVRVHAIKG
jgi:V/A-type H+-transporting ATPase subunit C